MKESEIVADYCPEYSASMEELKDFKGLIKKLEIDFAYACAVRVKVPRKYKNNHLDKINENSIDNNFNFDHVSVKEPEKTSNGNGFAYDVTTKSERKMVYKNFKKMIVPSPKLTIKEKEDLIWKMLSKKKELRPYVVDQLHTLFPKRCKIMNLNEFTYADSFLHAKLIEDIKGIQKSNIYIGQFYTAFAFHIEYFDLGAINFLHHGAEKIWYVVPHSQQEKFENLLNSFGNSLNVKCPEFSKHRTLIVPPSVLRKNGIKFSKIIQKPYEFVIILPGGYHAGFNCGVNIAEAMNFGCDSWLERFPKYKLCDCEDLNEVTSKIRYNFENLYKREIESKNNNNIIKCDLCSKTFKKKKYIARHMKNHKPKVARYFCPFCDKSYSRKSKVILHLKNSHEKENNPKNIKPRMVKNKVNPNKGKIKRHQKSCPKCDVILSSINSVNQHLLICQK